MQAYRTASLRWPLTTAFGTCMLKGSASDAVAQVLLMAAVLINYIVHHMVAGAVGLHLQ
jgi:hypothetical protein